MENNDKVNDKSQEQPTPEKDQDAELFEQAEENAAPEQETAEKEKAKPDVEKKAQVDEVGSLKTQIAEMNDRYIRLMAEFDNYKKRISREYERQVESANEKLMVEMVDIRENFERALRSGETCDDFNTLFEGMKLIFNKFDGVLNRNGLETFTAVGDPFDPAMHDALMKTPKEGVPEDHIAEIYERGYKLKNKVIKHAKVIVSSGAPASPDNAENSDNKDSK